MREVGERSETDGSSPGNSTRVGFTGHQQDNDIGFTDMGGRVYDSLAGRFTTADPVMQAPFWSQGQNRYAYVFNDPINATDPSGFMSTSETAGGIAPGLIGGGVTGGAYLATHGIPGAAGSLGGSLGGTGLGVLHSLSLSPGGPAPNTSYAVATPTAAPSSTLNKANGMGSAPGQAQVPGPAVQEGGGFAPQGAAPNAGARPQAPFVRDGRVTDAGRSILRRTFDRYNFDVGQIKVIFKKNLGQAGITLGNRVYLDDSFQYLSPYRQMQLLAHEITHSVQYRDLGKSNFLERYAIGYRQVDNYEIPTELWAVPTNKLSVTQKGSYLAQDGMRYDFTLDQVAERIGVETASALPYP